MMMALGVWRIRAGEAVNLARGDCQSGPAELLDPSLTITTLLRDPVTSIDRLEELTSYGAVPDGSTVLAPIDKQPVWAAGVTYAKSLSARMEEARDGGDVYDRIYEAARPELFFKSAGENAIGTGDQLGIRADSTWNVPEPELGIVADDAGRSRGYVLGNDMSSRSIEGDNPLYLPQAKTYDRSCGIGPCIVPLVAAGSWRDFTVELRVERQQLTVFDQQTCLTSLRRTPAELLDWLMRANSFPNGVVLLTGTGIVPPPDFTLRDHDVVVVRCPDLGELRNDIVTVGRG
jgi:2-dehydro-3-deoxy-D-arabinonate dehydratase